MDTKIKIPVIKRKKKKRVIYIHDWYEPNIVIGESGTIVVKFCFSFVLILFCHLYDIHCNQLTSNSIR